MVKFYNHGVVQAVMAMMGGLLHLVHAARKGGWAAAPPSHFLAVPNITVHLSTASVSITVLL